MKDANWQRIEDLFHEVSSLPDSAQQQYLDEHCGDDPLLKSRVLALLEAGREAGDFLEQTVQSAAAWAEQPDGRVGAYRLLHEIGRGGMGRVYLAERADQEYSRQVAIKIVRSDFSSPAMLHRFRVERQILANLDHPGIARLLDGGATDSGIPYLVMEYVDGVSIDNFCNQKSLSVAQRLKVFRKVCDAVSYAHRNLVVHRDIKPGNILVTSEGVPRLLDFGIAKVLEEHSTTEAATRATERMLTPEYSSPEQVLGKQVAVPSDVFMLGLLLYELLSGEPAFRFPSTRASDRERIICEIDPPLPSASTGAPGLNPKEVEGDLDAIVMKAIRKEPERRYASVEQLDNDIARWLEGLPVEARSGAWTYRTGKMIRRHRVPLLIATSIFLILGASAEMSYLSARRESRALKQSRAGLEAALAMANSSLFDIHASVSQLPGSTAAQALIVEKTLKSLTELEKNSEGDPGLQRELAVAYEKLSDIQFRDGPDMLGESQAAETSATKALRLRQQLAGAARQDTGAIEALAAAYVRLGEVYGLMRKSPEAIATYRQGLKTYHSLPGNSRPIRTAEAAARTSFADVLADEADPQPALDEIELALRERRELLKEASGNPDAERQAREGLEKTLEALGAIQRDRKADFAGAKRSLDEALEIARGLAAEDPDRKAYRSELASVINDMGHYWLQSGKPEQAMASYRESLGIVQALSLADPNDARSRRSVAIHGTNLALALERMGHVEEAEQSYRRAIGLHHELRAKNPANFQPIVDEAFARRALGQLLVKNGRGEQGRAELLASVKLGERLVQSAPSNSLYRLRLAVTLEALGDERRQARTCAEARPNYSRAIGLLKDDSAPVSGSAAKVLSLNRKLESCTG